jgi:pimeloyl-ACP methyl ester carboxylesterase
MGNEALLAAGYSILTPSRPGYGKTPASVGGTAAEAADAMALLLDALGIVRVAVIAVSGGGPTAIHLAARHPERVGKLVLEEAVSRYSRELDPERYEIQKKFYGPGYGATLFMLKAIATISPKAMARQTMALFGTHDPDEAVKEMDEGDRERIRRFYLSQRSSWAAGASNDMEHRTGDAVLNSIKAPTLVVHSREDKAVPFAAGEYSHANIPGSEL